MAETYEEAVELGEVYGRSEHEVRFGEYMRGIITGDVEVSETPPSIVADGKVFLVTPETLVRGLELSGRQNDRLPQTRFERAEDIFLSDSWIGKCCVDDKSESTYARAGSVACSGPVFGGFWVDDQGKIVASKVCPLSVSDQDLPIMYPGQDSPSRYRGGSYVDPSVLDIEKAQAIVDLVVPQKPKDFEIIVKDMLNNFVDVKKKQTYWSDEMNDGHSDNEPRDPRVQDILDTLGELDDKNRNKLGDDYSLNKSVSRIVKRILAGALTTFDAGYNGEVVIGAQQLGAAWAHLYAGRAWAERTSVIR